VQSNISLNIGENPCQNMNDDLENKSVDIPKNYDRGKNEEKNRAILNRILLAFFVALLLTGSFFIGFSEGEKTKNDLPGKNVPLTEAILKNQIIPDDKTVDFAIFWKVWDLVSEKHIDRSKINAQKMVYGAINGMLRATGDPYSYFFDPEENSAFSQDLEGSFDGIGAELGIKDEILTIMSPLEGSPAEKAGLKAGDKIIKINGKLSTDLSTEEAVDLIRGKKGTEVKLTILRSSEDETREITVIRDTIVVKSVKLDFNDSNIAHLKINKFGDATEEQFDDAVKEIIDKNARGIVLDVRNNPGGLLDACVNIASTMMPKDKVVVIEEDSYGKRKELKTIGGDKLSSIPMVVLINEGSASASEILAGALKDIQNITLVGKKTFGKGSVQELIDLPGNSSVKITVAKWLTPKGNYIMEKGIEPDIDIDLSADDFKAGKDPQLDKALEILKEKIK
jgi:carboxyl-terminal processing protease